MTQKESTEKLLNYYREKWLEAEEKLNNLYFVTINHTGNHIETKLFTSDNAADWYQETKVADLKNRGVMEGFSITKGKAVW
jgi:hypothetical protein